MKVWDGGGIELMAPGSAMGSDLCLNCLQRLAAEKPAASRHRVKCLQIY